MDQKQYNVFKAILQGKIQKVVAEENNLSPSRVGQIVAKVCREITSSVMFGQDEDGLRRIKALSNRYKPVGDLEFWTTELENLWTKLNKDKVVNELSRHRHIQEHHLGYLHSTLIGYRGVAYALGKDYRIYVHHQSIQMRTEKQAIAHLATMRKRYGPTLVYGIQEVHVQEPHVIYPAEQ